jgi:kynurenine formamidase
MKSATLPGRSRVGLVWLLALAACAAPSGQRDLPSAGGPPAVALDLDAVRVVDLTYPFDERTIYWPTAPSTFKLERLAYGPTPAGFFYAANAFCTPEHGGTHLDAPLHFGEGQASADEVPVDQLIATAVVIDVSPEAAADRDYQLSRDDVVAFERRHGAVPAGAIVLLRTGWAERWPDPVLYLGDDTPGDASNLHFPSYGADAAEYLVGERHVGALGVDTASIDPGNSQDFPVHRIAALANVPGLENLANLDQVPEKGAWVIALPMKIAGGTGGPLRIVALVP